MTEETKSDAARKSCQHCELHLSIDDGYSNYTVTSTTVYCAIGQHPSGRGGYDPFYGSNEEGFFAEECARFQAGAGIWIEVEGDEIPELSPSQKALYDAWSAAE